MFELISVIQKLMFTYSLGVAFKLLVIIYIARYNFCFYPVRFDPVLGARVVLHSLHHCSSSSGLIRGCYCQFYFYSSLGNTLHLLG